MSKGWKRFLKITAAIAVLFFVFVGVAHTKWGRPLLGLLTGVPGCPAGFGEGDPASVEAMRKSSVVARTATAAQTQTHPALVRADGQALELGKATRAEVTAWLGDAIKGCKELREGQVITCENPAVAIDGPKVGDLHLQFLGDVLVAVDVFRADTEPHIAMQHFQMIGAEVEKKVGPATKAHGQVEAAWLGAMPLRQTSLEFNYKGYVAELSVTNLGPRGVRMREQYQWTAM